MKKLLLGVLIFTSLLSQAQNPNYTELGGPYGGGIQDYVSTGGVIVGVVQGQGIVRSTDNGISWSSSNTGITDTYLYDLELDAGASKIYALAYNKLFASSDGGTNWVTVASSGFTQAALIKKAPNGNLYIAQNATNPKKIYRSTNNGTTWTSIATITVTGNAPFSDFEIGPNNHLYLSTSGGGVYKSTTGTSFSQLSTLTDLNIRSMTMIGSDIYAYGSTGPFKSTDSGATWNSVKSNIPDSNFSGIIESGSGTLFLFNDFSSKVYSSSTGGTSWVTTLKHPNTVYGGIYLGGFQSAFVSSSADVFVSLYSGPFISSDGGANWSDGSSGIAGLWGYDLFMSSNGILLYASGSYQTGFHRSDDQGATWSYKYQNGANRTIYGFVNGVSGTMLAYGNGLAKSTDDGATWTQVSTTNLPQLVTNDGTNLFSTDQTTGLKKSSDAGVTWTTQTLTGLPAGLGTGSANLDKMILDAAGNIYYLIHINGSNQAQVYKINSSTLVATQLTNVPTSVYDLDTKNGKLYAAAQGALMVSIDAGVSWVTRSNPIGYGKVRAIDDNTIYLLSDVVYVSTDAAGSWVNTGIFGNSNTASDVVVSADNYAYLAVDYSVLLKSAKQVVPPLAPSSLTVTGTNHTRVQLTWTDNSTNEDYFLIEKSKDNNLNYDSAGVVLANTYASSTEVFINVPLANQSTYFFRVRAVSAAGKSAYTNEVSGSTLTNCTSTSSIPVNRSWTGTTLNESGVGVKTNSLVTIGAQGTPGFYTLDNLNVGAASAAPFSHSETNPSFPVIFSENCGSVYLLTSIPVPNVSGGSADGNNGNGTWDPNTNKLTIHWKSMPKINVQRTETTVFTINAVDPVPTTPTNPIAFVANLGTVAFSWAASKYAEEYVVERSTTSASSGFSELTRVNYKTFSILDAGLTQGATYYYQVRARNAKGVAGAEQTSGFSSVAQVTVQQPLFASVQIGDYNPDLKVSYAAGWSDLDADGYDDVVVSYIGADLFLRTFRNKGNGTFEELSYATPLTGNWSGVTMADFNNDGKNDILTATNTTGKNTLWINKGGNIGFDKTEIYTPSQTTYSPSFADFNKDGLLDILFQELPLSGGTKPLKIYTQQSDHTLIPYDVGAVGTDNQNSWSHSWADFDNDNDLDLLVDCNTCNAPVNHRLYRNDGLDANGFAGFTLLTGTAFETDQAMVGESSSWADYDNDGDLDVFKGNTGPTGSLNDMLYKNNGDGTFTRVPTSLPTEIWSTGSQGEYTNGSAWGDVDNDGDQDLLVVRDPQSTLYLNAGNGTFTKYGNVEFISVLDRQRSISSASFSDYDQDGRLDLFFDMSGSTLPPSVLKNTGSTGKWIQFKLTGTTSNRSAIGARVTLNLPSGKKQIREVTTTSGWGGQNSLTVHFGLGNLVSVPSVDIRWPSGITQTLTNVTPNQILNITEDNTGPILLTSNPAQSGTNVDTTTKLEITLDESATAVATKNIALYKTSDPSAPVFTALVTAGTKTGNTYSFTMPGKLLLSTNYYVALDAGAFVDAYGNSSLVITGSTWSFTTTAGPDVTTLVPANGATNVANDVSIELTFNKAITAVAGKKLKVLDGATTVLDADVSTAGTVSGTKYTLPAPTSKWPYQKTLTVTIEEGAFVDVNQNNNKEVTSGQYAFTTIERPDLTPPVITFDPADFNKLEKGFSPKTLSISATDDKGVTSASIYHRKTGDKDYVLANLTLNPAGKWETIVGSNYADEMGFEYYFVARDAAQHKGRLPADSTRFLSRVTLTNANRPQLDLPGGATQNSWKVIAVPHELSNSQIETVFSTLGPADKTKWKIIRLTANPLPLGAWVEYPASGFTDVERGRGYFINTKDVAKITLLDPTTPSNTRDNLFSISLVKGWNQVGNPYTTPIKWSEAIAYNNASATVGSLKTFTGGTYVAGDELAEFQGGFVNVQEDVPNFKIPFKGQTLSGGRIADRTPSLELNETDWRVPITLTQKDVVNELSAIGMDPEASTSFDEHDDATPPRFFDYLELSFDHPEHFTKKFSHDVVPTQNEYTWEFAVSTNLEGPAELTWNNTVFGSNEKELYLLDVQNQSLVSMRDVQHFAFDPRQSGKFKLFFGTNLKSKIMPAKVFLGKAYPNPTTGMTTIPFSLPDQAAGYQVTLEVYDMMGRKINTIINGTFNSGFYNSEWDASMGGLSNGIYTYRLAVSSPKGTEVQSGKIVIKK